MVSILCSAILAFSASAAWIVHDKKNRILPENPSRIHFRISIAMRDYLKKKKNIHLPLQIKLLDHYGGERINVVAKNDVELAKIYLFFDLIGAIARKKFGFDGEAEGLVPPHINVFATGEEDRLRWDKRFREKKMREQKMRPLTLEDIIANDEILEIIAAEIARKSKQNVEKEDVLQTIKEYIPYIKEITDSYPQEPNFYKKMLEGAPDATLIDKLLPQINSRMYRAMEKLAEKMEEDFKEVEQEPTAAATFPASTTKIITKKEPALEDIAIESLKRMGVDLKLETGNVPERKSKIFSWLVQNGLIKVEEENGKPVVRATDELNRIVGKIGAKSAAAMIKWAAEEGAAKEHVEPLAKILGALEEFRQVAKRDDPALAKALKKAMKSKHTVRELLHVSVGMLPLEELSEKWKDKFGLSLIELLRKSPELTGAFIESMGNLRELASHEVPVEWVSLLKMLDGKTPKEELERALKRVTLLRMVFSAYESLAIRGLPENGKDVTRRMMDILERAKVMVPSADITNELRAELQVLSKVTALMKDETYIEAIEEAVAPIVAKIPETKKVGLFKRESPRRKVEDFVAVLMEGNLSEEEAEAKGEELERYLRDYLGEKEARELVNNLMLPFRAKLLLKRYSATEDFLFDYAHSKASRLLLIEARLAETLRGRKVPHDAILRTIAGAPSLLGRKRITLRSFERNRETLKRLLG